MPALRIGTPRAFFFLSLLSARQTFDGRSCEALILFLFAFVLGSKHI
jgi:hypothetical protein